FNQPKGSARADKAARQRVAPPDVADCRSRTGPETPPAGRDGPSSTPGPAATQALCHGRELSLQWDDREPGSCGQAWTCRSRTGRPMQPIGRVGSRATRHPPRESSFWVQTAMSDAGDSHETRSEEHTSELQSRENLVC